MSTQNSNETVQTSKFGTGVPVKRVLNWYSPEEIEAIQAWIKNPNSMKQKDLATKFGRDQGAFSAKVMAVKRKMEKAGLLSSSQIKTAHTLNRKTKAKKTRKVYQKKTLDTVKEQPTSEAKVTFSSVRIKFKSLSINMETQELVITY